MNAQMTFGQRTARMRKAAIDLAILMASMKEIGEVVAEEADQMTAAEKRFAARDRKSRNTKASR